MSIINETTYIGSGSPYDIVLSMESGVDTLLNQNYKDIDLGVFGTEYSKQLFFDASTGRLGIGTGVPDATLHIVAPCAKDGVIIESVTNCPTGVTLLLLHNPQTPPTSGSIPSTLNLAGRDENYNEIVYGQIYSKILDPITSQTSGEIYFTVDATGDNREIFVGSINRILLGAYNTSSGNQYSIIGQANYASGSNFNIIGSNNSGNNLSESLLLGNANNYIGSNLLSVSTDSIIDSSGSLVLGKNNNISGNNNILLNLNSQISGSGNTVLGSDLNVSGISLLVFSNNSLFNGMSGIFLGNNINSSGNNTIQLGNNISNSGDGSTIFGTSDSSIGNSNVIYGNNTSISGNSIISVGNFNVLDNAEKTIVVGNNIPIDNSAKLVFIGLDNQTVSGLVNSVVIGDSNILDNDEVNDLILLGHGNITEIANNSLFIGNTNNVSGNLKNTLVIGSGNAIINDGFNNILMGTANNVTGIYLNSQGETTGEGTAISSNQVNTISIGHNNLSYLGSANTVLGNKNTVSGTNINSVGSYNKLLNTNNIYNLGNSNYIDGRNTVTIGKNIVSYGQNNIVMNNTDSVMNIYGSGSIVIGNNPVVSSGVVLGYNNTINSINNLVLGKNNYIGYAKHLFTSTNANPQQITINSLVGSFYKQNDGVLLQIKSPAGENNNFYGIIVSVVENEVSGQTTISLAIAGINLSDRYFSINETFDENNIANTTITGYITLLYESDSGKYFGTNTLIFGDNNDQKYQSGIIIGNNSESTGLNTVIIGNNITNVDDNSIHIGSSNTNKIVFNDDYIVFNTGTTQRNIIYRSFDGSITTLFDLQNNRIGVGNSSPRSDIDVSGLITTNTLRVGLGAVSGHVLTANSDGYANWERPVRLSGINDGLLYRVNDKVASGISSIKYSEAIDGLNFYDNFYIGVTGAEFNSNKGSDIVPKPFVVWGSGGPFAPKLLETIPGPNTTYIYDLSGYAGRFDVLDISYTGNVVLPTALTGTFLYADVDGSLKSKTNPANTVMFAGPNSWSSGNTKFRWFDDSNVMALGNTLSTNNVISNGEVGTYNIVLSCTGAVDTVFNNQGLNHSFIVVSSGDNNSVTPSSKRGFHILPTGRVIINGNPGNLVNSTSSMLYVGGEVHAESFRMGLNGAFPAEGTYLRIAQNGAIEAQTPTFDLSFSGIYPIKTTTNSSQIQISISDLASQNSSTTLDVRDNGRLLAWDGDEWVTASGLRLYQVNPDSNTQPKGIMIGNNLSFNPADVSNGTPKTTNQIVYGDGSFNTQNGTSQFSQHHLRAVTPKDGSTQIAYLLKNQNLLGSIGRAANNTIRYPDDDAGNWNLSWTYKIYVNAFYQRDINLGGNKGAFGYIITGGVSRIEGNISSFGEPNIETLGSPPEAAVGISIETQNNDTFDSLDIVVTGVNDYKILWSATAQINEMNWPNSVDI